MDADDKETFDDSALLPELQPLTTSPPSTGEAALNLVGGAGSNPITMVTPIPVASLGNKAQKSPKTFGLDCLGLLAAAEALSTLGAPAEAEAAAGEEVPQQAVAADEQHN